MQPSPWWDARVHADRRPFLLARGRILAALRRWFEAEGFVEVETSALQVSPGNETHLHAFATELIEPDGARRPLYLHTSPEFACKKLLAAGEQRIFTFAPVFRNRERGALHHPAFTMLEWYRAGEPYERLMEDCAALLRIAAEAVGFGALRFGERSADPLAAPERVTVAEAFSALRRHRSARRRFGGTALPDRRGRALCRQPHGAAGIRVADDDTWGDIFSRVLVERIEPQLGNGRATLLTEYPAHLAALARPKASDPRVAERFELYACGVELANAFGELTDPDRAAPAPRGRDGREAAHLGRALSDRRGFPRRPRAHAAGERRRAGLRPAGDAGDRRHPHRAGDLDAGGVRRAARRRQPESSRVRASPARPQAGPSAESRREIRRWHLPQVPALRFAWRD